MTDGLLVRFVREPQLVLDTKPIWLHAAATFSRNALLPEYDSEMAQQHFLLMDAVVRSGRQIFVTPYVLGEVFARVRHVKDPRSMARFLQRYRGFLVGWRESWVPKDDLLVHGSIHLGIADTSVLVAALKTDSAVLTTDQGLISACAAEGVPAFNYDRIFDNREFLARA